MSTGPYNERDLGMNRPIARRDFLNGMAIGVTTGVAALKGAQAQSDSASAASYPPARVGLRGNYPAAVSEFDRISEGQYARSDAAVQEQYDLVIVGGGISGLSAAYFYRMALGPDPRILILDNHDDFGGHAKRNEFHYQGKTFVGFGGTMGIATPYPYSYCAKASLIAPCRNCCCCKGCPS
jgi:spermidine dehydrogenase